eukprot:5625489-Alexandrium_andersonii.AAC.1
MCIRDRSGPPPRLHVPAGRGHLHRTREVLPLRGAAGGQEAARPLGVAVCGQGGREVGGAQS